MPTKTKATAKKRPAKKSVVKKATVMPAKKTPTKKKVASKAPAKKMSTLQITEEEVKSTPNICHTCHSLPVGAVELLSILMVVTFSLSAVLLTASYAIDQQARQIETLQMQVHK